MKIAKQKNFTRLCRNKTTTLCKQVMQAGLAFLLTTFTISCTEQKDGDAKKTELERLKTEVAGKQAEILKLEEELALNDSAKNDKIKTVEIIPLVPQLFNNYIDVQGKVDADENVSVSAQAGGIVTDIFVKIGDEVHKDQVLAELDSKIIQQGISELQNALELAATMYEKQKNLWDQKIGTEMQYLSVKNQKESLEKKIATLRQQMEMLKIKSPINGIIDAVDIKPGQAAMPGLPAIRVVNLSALKVKGEVAEAYASKIKNGNPVEIIFPDMNDTMKTKITYAAKVISPLNRTFTVTVNLDNNKEYHPNEVAIIKIIDYANPDALVVPVNTIQKAEDGDFIFVANNKHVKKLRVKVGKIYNGKAEIAQGLKEGDMLIIKGFQDLNEGEEVKF